MLNHTTVTITKKHLGSLNPCESGLANARHLFPLTISTDPEENIEAALALVDTERGARDLKWFAEALGVLHTPDLSERLDEPDHNTQRGRYIGLFETYRESAIIAAQWLAAIADALAVKAGR